MVSRPLAAIHNAPWFSSRLWRCVNHLLTNYLLTIAIYQLSRYFFHDIYRGWNFDYRTPLTQAVWLAPSRPQVQRHVLSISASLFVRKPFALIVLDAPSHDGTPADIRMHFIYNKYLHRSTFGHYWHRSIFVEIFLVGAGIFVNFVSAVQGHPSSVILVSIESAYVTSY